MKASTDVEVPKQADLMKTAGIPASEKRIGKMLKRWFDLYRLGDLKSYQYEEAVFLLGDALEGTGYNRVEVMSSVIDKFGQ